MVARKSMEQYPGYILGVPVFIGIWRSAGYSGRNIRFFSRLTEPFIEFFRYLPAPAFGALAVAILGIYQAPKIAIIFIGTFFQQVLIIANTTRKLDPSLLEAAQTLGAKNLPCYSGWWFRELLPTCTGYAYPAGLGVDLPDRCGTDRYQFGYYLVHYPAGALQEFR